MPSQSAGQSNNVVRVCFEDLRVERYEQAGFSISFQQQIYDAALLLNREAIDILQRNVNANFGLLRRLAAAKSLGEIVGLQVAHFSNQNAALFGQAEELAALITKATINLWRTSLPGRQ